MTDSMIAWVLVDVDEVNGHKNATLMMDFMIDSMIECVMDYMILCVACGSLTD